MDRCDSCGAVCNIKVTYKYTDGKEAFPEEFYCTECYYQSGPRP